MDTKTTYSNHTCKKIKTFILFILTFPLIPIILLVVRIFSKTEEVEEVCRREKKFEETMSKASEETEFKKE